MGSSGRWRPAPRAGACCAGWGGALAGLAAGLLALGGAGADGCKAGGKACSKGSQCCSGVCGPPPGKTSVAHSGSVCCTPEPPSTTCAGVCGPQTNNCGQGVACGGCPNYTPCTADAQCASGICNSAYLICYECFPTGGGRGSCKRDADCCSGTCDISTEECV